MLPSLSSLRLEDEGLSTSSSRAQAATEDECECWLLARVEAGTVASTLPHGLPPQPLLQRASHVAYLRRVLRCASAGGGLGASGVALDASRLWLCYWVSNGLDVLGAPADSVDAEGAAARVVHLVRASVATGGGLGGGPAQTPHALSTYAGVLAALACGRAGLRALSPLRLQLRASLLAGRCAASGAFRAHEGGEADARGTYAALAVCSLLGTPLPAAARSSAASFLRACQTYEGGFGGEPGAEAHGGYTWCAVAGLALLGELHSVRLAPLLRWLCMRQMRLEGGFSGRANKLVDGCYSFWVGASLTILERLGGVGGADDASALSPPLWDRARAARYVLACCQGPNGGLRDKPSKLCDQYHTCYALAGLSLAQHDSQGRALPVADHRDLLEPVDPLYNLLVARVTAAHAFFDPVGETDDADSGLVEVS